MGQDGILRPIGNRPSDAFGRRVANPPQDAILPHIAPANDIGKISSHGTLGIGYWFVPQFLIQVIKNAFAKTPSLISHTKLYW